MKQNLKRLAGALALCAVLAGCALLPTALAWVRDYQQHGAVRTTKMEPIAMGSDEQYSLIERFQLAGSELQLYHNVQTMSFATGVNYDHTTAIQNARTQLDALYAHGLIPVNSVEFEEFFVESIEYAADADDPARNLMVWTIGAFSDRYYAQAFMDDESGLLLSFWLNGTDAWMESMELTTCAKAWSDYLGLTLQEGHDTLTREKDADMALEIYDVVRPAYDAEYRKKYGLVAEELRALRVTLKDGKSEIVYRIYSVASECGIVLE